MIVSFVFDARRVGALRALAGSTRIRTPFAVSKLSNE